MTDSPGVVLWPNNDRKCDFHWSGAALSDDRLRALALGAYVDRRCRHASDSLWRECHVHAADVSAVEQAAIDLREG